MIARRNALVPSALASRETVIRVHVQLSCMGFGSTAKKLQSVADVADKLQNRFERLREQVNDLSETVDETHDRVERIENELTDQRELLEAIAESEGVDVPESVDDND